jgi:hypothetical protein
LTTGAGSADITGDVLRKLLGGSRLREFGSSAPSQTAPPCSCERKEKHGAAGRLK